MVIATDSFPPDCPLKSHILLSVSWLGCDCTPLQEHVWSLGELRLSTSNHSSWFKSGTRAGEPEISVKRLSLPTGFSKQWKLSLEMLVAIFDVIAE